MTVTVETPQPKVKSNNGSSAPKKRTSFPTSTASFEKPQEKPKRPLSLAPWEKEMVLYNTILTIYITIFTICQNFHPSRMVCYFMPRVPVSKPLVFTPLSHSFLLYCSSTGL